MNQPPHAPKSSFKPIVDERTRLLVLGSLPGEISLAANRYYANPRNQFWRLIGAVIGADLVSLPYEDRLATLSKAGIGLWDVVASASRTGSLDGSIRLHHANDLAGLASALSELRAIAFNGGTAARIGMKQLGGTANLALIPLPSSSPAFTIPFETKLKEWMAFRKFLS